MTSGAVDAREAAVAETAAGRVVDALQLGDRLGVLADLDRERDVVAAAAGIVRIGDLDRRRLQVAPAPIAALRVAGLDREDHPLGERHAGALGRLERRRDRLDHFRTDHDVGLHRVVAPLPAAGPVVVLLAGVRRRAALHVDHADLPRLALLVVGQQLRRARPAARRPSRADRARAGRTRPRRRLRADGADAGADVRHRAADERHARRHARARLAGRRIDRAERERGVLRQPFVVDGDAVRRALLREGVDGRTSRCAERERSAHESHTPDASTRSRWLPRARARGEVRRFVPITIESGPTSGSTRVE